MSKAFAKKKEKRPRTSSNEANTSFVKNVTSRVSGFLPATITKWFSSPSSSKVNGSTPTAEVTDSSTEDEATETPVVSQPPAKRMRLNSSNKYSHFSPTDANCSISSIEITEIPASTYTGMQYPANNRNSVTLTPIRTPSETTINESIKDKSDKETHRLKSIQHTVSSIGQSVATKRKSIFDKSSQEDTPKPSAKPSSAEKRPYFKPSLLGSPFYPGRTMYGGAASSYMNQPNIQQHTVALVKETKSSEDSAMSSSTRRIMDLLESYSSPLMEARRIPQYTKPKNNSITTPTERFTPYANSLSAKTYYELHMPSIASILRSKQRSRLMDCTKTARQIIASHSSASNYPLTYTPAAATYIPETSKSKNTIQTTQPTQLGQETNNEQSLKMTTKLKARVARPNRGIPDHLDIATPVKLPSATLQIDQDKLPKFSLDAPDVSHPPAMSMPKVLPAPKAAEVRKNMEDSTSKPETVTSSNFFKFTDPIKISCDNLDVDTTPPKFIFESPERRIDQHFDTKNDDSSVVGDGIDKFATKDKDWQCPDCRVHNKSGAIKCVCCGLKQALKVAKCAMCKLADCHTQKDICVNCDKMVNPPSIQSQPSKWKCDGCWVMNEVSVGKCACCGANQPTEMSKAAAKAATAEFTAFPKVKAPTCGGCFTVGAGTFNLDLKQIQSLPIPPTDILKSSDKSDSKLTSLAKTQKLGKWECSSCLVMNEEDRSVCVCCGAKKATSNIDLKQVKASDNSSNSFISLAKAQKSDKWECSSCLAMNENAQCVCVCCGAQKVLSNTDSKQAKATDKGDNSLISFAKAQKSDKWECSSCLAMNENAQSECVCCGKEKVKPNIASKQVKATSLPSNTTTFFGSNDNSNNTFISLAKNQKSDKWECSSCLVMNESTRSMCVCCDAEKESKGKLLQPKFNFGLNINTTFKFGIDPKVQQATISKNPDLHSKSDPKLKELSETNNNVLAKTPTFTFTLPTKKIETKTDTVKAKPEEPVKFNFGIPKDADISANKSEPAKILDADNEKPQEVPQVNFFASQEEKPKLGGLFSATTTQVETDKPIIPPPNLFASPSVEAEKSKSSNPITLQPPVTVVEKTPPPSTFTLGSSSIKPVSSLFAGITPAKNIFSPPQSSAAPTNTPAIASMLPAVLAPNIETTSAAPASTAPMFTFGAKAINNTASMSGLTSAAAPADKPQFQFTFGSTNSTTTEAAPSISAAPNSQPVMKSLFAPPAENNANNAFNITPGNAIVPNNPLTPSALGNANGLSSTNGLGGNTLSGTAMGGNALSGNSLSGNLLSGNTMSGSTFSASSLTGGNGILSSNNLGGTNGMSGNTLNVGNGLQPNNTLANNSIANNSLTSGASNIFGNTVQKENMWNANNSAPSTNMFASNTTTSNMQKPGAFTFGTASPFNNTSSTPTFGNNTQPTSNIFGMASQNNNVQPSLFSSPVQNQSPSPMFGSAQPNSDPPPQMDMFRTSSMGTTPAFGGTPSASIPSFEASSMTPAPPQFNFGTASQSPGVFGFGQQQMQQQAQSTGGFNFCAASPVTPQGQVQFAMGTGQPTQPTQRKIRRARRTNR